MSVLEKAIRDISTAATPMGVFAEYSVFLKTFGYGRVIYNFLNDHPSLGQLQKIAFASSFPDLWIDRYLKSDYATIDPIIARLKLTNAPIEWETVANDPQTEPAARNVLLEAEDFDLYNGVSIALAGNTSERANIGFARSTRCKSSNRDLRLLADVHLVTAYFQSAFRERLIAKSPRPRLTTRQHDILTWAAEGKSNSTIGVFLSLSERCIEYHLRSAYVALGVSNRTFAVAKALQLGLIEPVSVNTVALPSRNTP